MVPSRKRPAPKGALPTIAQAAKRARATPKPPKSPPPASEGPLPARRRRRSPPRGRAPDKALRYQ
eukprot:15163455-Alexandrium_andersonii.AAC.1